MRVLKCALKPLLPGFCHRHTYHFYGFAAVELRVESYFNIPDQPMVDVAVHEYRIGGYFAQVLPVVSAEAGFFPQFAGCAGLVVFTGVDDAAW